VHVVAGEQAHVTVLSALRYLGLGAGNVRKIATDSEGRMRPDALRDTLRELQGPIIVCAQAGDVNSGAFDFFSPVIDAAHEAGAWVHVDGAFGLWAAATPERRRLMEGAERADSWSTDAHKC
jgi:glutamate/tyrosine decarboxylase-like PLP-dependent enzyme